MCSYIMDNDNIIKVIMHTYICILLYMIVLNSRDQQGKWFSDFMHVHT